jgi:hypothetical protein
MKAYTLSVGTLLIALALVSTSGPSAQAQGFHFGGGGVHVDVGNPHSYYGGYGGYGQSNCYGSYPYTSYYGGGWGGHSDWHDTTHLDYHPGEYVRHRNHYHYVPGHYDVHEDGHWDHHGF